MKRKIIIIVVCLVVLTAAGLTLRFFFRQFPLISQPYVLVSGNTEKSASDLTVNTVKYNGSDISASIDKARLVELLSKYRCKRSYPNPFPMPRDNILWEIDITHEYKPVFIVLCKDTSQSWKASAFRYSSGQDAYVYEIIDSGTLMTELEVLK